MKVLLTGATGFIGSHVARLIVLDGEELYAVIRPRSELWRIADVRASLSVVPCDLRSFEELDACLEKIRPDVCLHLAWYAEPATYRSSPENVTMLNASLRLAYHLGELGCRRFVATGSCYEYASSGCYLSENSATKPTSLYAASKLALHAALEQLASVCRMDVAWARLFYLYGPSEDRQRLVPSVIGSLLNNQRFWLTSGDQIRDVLHVEDVAAAIWAIARSDVNGVVNVGSGQPVTVRDLAVRIGDMLGRRELISERNSAGASSDRSTICANNQRLKDRTAWRPHYDLDRGLRHTIDWWRARIDIAVP